MHDDVAAQLCAWPGGCIDTTTMRIPEDPEPACGHVQADAEEAIGDDARELECGSSRFWIAEGPDLRAREIRPL